MLMYQDDPNLDQRLSRFEAQLDRFSLALHQWQQFQEQHAPASPRDVDQRIRTIEETLDREAHALRQMHEEPLKQLQAQAASLREICVAAANSVNGLDQAESRLAAFQADVHLHLSELSRNLQAIVADLRIGTSTAVSAPGPAAVWPLERVVHLHNELRQAAATQNDLVPHAPAAADAPSSVQPSAGQQPLHAADVLAGRLQSLERTVAGGQEESSRAAEARGRQRRSWYIAGIAAVAVVGLLAFGFERRIESRLNEAAARVAAAEREATAATQAANREIATARQDADRQIGEARQSAQRAETVGAILTAPDLVRFSLTSGNVERSSAQLLWSRTRGLVLSASRLPAAPPETTYQLWLITNAEPVSAGLFAPDPTGRAALVTDAVPKVPGPVLGAEVTLEPSGGRPAPSGRVLLARPPS